MRNNLPETLFSTKPYSELTFVAPHKSNNRFVFRQSHPDELDPTSAVGL